MSRLPQRPPGFTLIELMVVVAIIAVLAALLLPALASANGAGKRAACVSNLRQIGIGVQAYANDSDGRIPYGPKAPPFTSPASFYPSTGAPTSLLSLRGGGPAGLGLLLPQHLSAQPRVLFCPAADQPLDAVAELGRVGANQAQGSYYYRHGGNTRLFDDPSATNSPPPLRLEALGNNRDGLPIRALVIDSQFLPPPDLEEFNIRRRTHHRRATVNFLRTDGGVTGRGNRDDRYTVDLRGTGHLHTAFDRILSVLEAADAAE
jgi:prepilin-type N-terminal cleavage/methylation domain-containing protein